MLIVWLCALFAHNGHAEIVSQIDSDVQCQLCQNTLDGVTGVPTQTPFENSAKLELVTSVTCPLLANGAKLRPPLRAPPVTSHF